MMGWGDCSLLLRDSSHVRHASNTLVGEHGVLSIRVMGLVQVELRGKIGDLFGSLPPPPTVACPGTSATGRKADTVHK